MKAGRRVGFTLIEIMVVIAIVGIIVALAIPKFLTFQSKAKQAEVRSNLRAIFVAERAYFGSKDSYSSQFSDISYAPEKGNRYNYTLGGSVITQDTVMFPNVAAAPSTWPTVTVAGGALNAPGAIPGGTGAFLAGAYANIDPDATVDTWTVASDTAVLSSGGRCNDSNSAGGGLPLVIIDDVGC